MSPNGTSTLKLGTALVIGGGIIGLATAYSLCRRGLQVTLLDEGPVEKRASSATAGIIGGSSVIPWAHSKLWPHLPKHLLNHEGPLRAARPLPRNLMKFFIRSLQAGRTEARAASASGLANLGLRGWDSWQDLLYDLPDARDLFVQNGCLFYYGTVEDAVADSNSNAIRRSFGMDLTELDALEMRTLLPSVTQAAAAGVSVNSAGHVVDPIGLQEKLHKAILATGAKLVEQNANNFEFAEGKVVAVATDKGFYDADTFILCAGYRSSVLAAHLGHRIQMIPAWGASVTFINSEVDLRMPFLILSDGIAVTPSSAGLRISGLLQVGGAGNAKAMIRALIDQAKRLFGDFKYTDIATFAGPRPLSADSLAFLGTDPVHDNLYHNYGHGHWGLTQAAISAQIIGDLVLGLDPKIEINAYRPHRN